MQCSYLPGFSIPSSCLQVNKIVWRTSWKGYLMLIKWWFQIEIWIHSSSGLHAWAWAPHGQFQVIPVQNMNLRFFSTFWSDLPGCQLPAAASSNQPTATCRESAGVGGTKLWRRDKVQDQAGDGKLAKRIMRQRPSLKQRKLPTAQSRTTPFKGGKRGGRKRQDKKIVLKTTVSWMPLWKTWTTIYSDRKETVKCTNQKLS